MVSAKEEIKLDSVSIREKDVLRSMTRRSKRRQRHHRHHREEGVEDGVEGGVEDEGEDGVEDEGENESIGLSALIVTGRPILHCIKKEEDCPPNEVEPE